MRKQDVLLVVILIVVAILLFNKFSSGNDKSDTLTTLKNNEIENTGNEKQERLNIRDEKNTEVTTNRSNAITQAVEIVGAAVVSVNVIKTEVVQRYVNPFENPFFGFFDNVPYRREVKGIGSGVIISDDGYIITNAHVVEGATKLTVMLPDARQFDGKLVGHDKIHDIAVIKIVGNDLPVAELGTSSDLMIGEWAIAVGNPYGLLIKDSKPSVSVGVISAIERNFSENRDGKVYRKMIQTDAAINPGNSGGPLVNIFGKVIGINTFIFSESGGSIGIGFSIPIDRVRKITNELIEHGKIRDIWFGFRVQDINPIMASYLGLESTDGVIVNTLDQNGPADLVGLEKGDIITRINGSLIKNTDDAELAVSDIAVGDQIKLRILRNQKEIDFHIDALEYK